MPARRAGRAAAPGFLTVRTGPLAAAGRRWSKASQLFLKERNNVIAGR